MPTHTYYKIHIDADCLTFIFYTLLRNDHIYIWLRNTKQQHKFVNWRVHWGFKLCCAEQWRHKVTYVYYIPIYFRGFWTLYNSLRFHIYTCTYIYLIVSVFYFEVIFYISILYNMTENYVKRKNVILKNNVVSLL